MRVFGVPYIADCGYKPLSTKSSGVYRLFPRCLETPPRARKGWGQAGCTEVAS